MRLIGETHIDFLKYRRFWIAISFAVIAIGVAAVFYHGKLNVGIDFAGGTQFVLRFQEKPEPQQLRDLMAAAGIREASIQRFGLAEDNEVMIRTPTVEGTEEGSGAQVLKALNERFNAAASGGFDLNQQGSEALTNFLIGLDPDGVGSARAAAHYGGVAAAIAEVRKEVGLISSWDRLAGVSGVSAQTLAALKSNAHLGRFAVLSLENVGPQVGGELRQRGIYAVVLSLLGMLVYIWVRFELRFGIGAVMASLHDVLVTLGLFALAGFEFNLTTIAAFLTLVGYSVNDTVVVFDRVRENMRKHRGDALLDIMNLSINQTLSRTILTGGTTILASGTLLAFGGDVIRGFAFVMTVGVIVGTYSSVYIASPFALLWEKLFGKSKSEAGSGRGAMRERGASAGPTTSRPARRTGGR